MVNFLNKILDVLPSNQKASIKNLIANKAKAGELQGVRAKEEEASIIYNRIKTKLGNVLLTPIYAKPDDKISSDDYNKVMEEIYLDLSTLYTHINDFSSLINKQSVILDSDYNKSRAAIEKLLNDVKIFALRKTYPEFNEIKLIDFNVQTNHSKKQPIANVEPNTRLLQLKPAINSRVHLLNRTARTTKIYSKTLSPGLKGDLGSSFPLENMVDQRPETFWATLIMTDSPVSQIYEKNTTTGNNYQVAVEGPIVEVYFKFSHSEKINNIRLAPFAEFPVTILDIAYKSTASAQIFTPIKDFTSTSTLDWEEYNFSPIFAHEIRIVLSQENYKKLSYLLPKSLVINTDLFQRILKQRASEIVGNSIIDSDFTIYALNSLTSYEEALTALEELYKNSGLDATVQPNIEFVEKLDSLLKEIFKDISPEIYVDSTTPTVNLFKYEYLLGLREVEIGYQVYYPTSYYESEKFDLQATVSEIQIEVDERHTSFETNWENDYRKTSTEWEIDIGNGRRLPIHPRNITDSNDGIPSVKDERVEFDLLTRKAYTRLGGYYSVVYKLKKNGELIPSNDFTVLRTTGSIPRLEISLTGNYFDTSSIYTVDYAVDPSSYSIDILRNFNSELVPAPEVFTEVGSNNEITLSKFPFINYEIINSTGLFIKNSSNSTWSFSPPQADASSGQLHILPTIIDNVGNILQTGSLQGSVVTGTWGTNSGESPVDLTTLSNAYFSPADGIRFGYFLKPMDSATYGHIDSFDSSTGFTLKSPLVVTQDQCRRWDAASTGTVFIGTLTGNIATGYLTVDYSIGAGVISDNQIFAISEISYEPIEVTVGTKKAHNITNYETLLHPAFSIANNKDTEYQYIQAGKTLYFNQNINSEIRVTYRWITEYLKLIGTLYCNTPINPDLTPKVNSIRIFTNNLVI